MAAKSPPKVREVLDWLKRHGTRRYREGLARYGIVAHKSFGVSVGTLKQQARRLGRDHDLALGLWDTGWYEARMLASLIDDPERVTPSQMDRWVRDFDNWGICDTVCFLLFDRTPHAWGKIRPWSRRCEEFVKRSAFVLLAGLALHDKGAGDERFLRVLPLIERAASDERNFVKKGVSWALRAMGQRSPTLHAASVKVARRLAESTDATPRWVGKDALRDLTRPMVLRRLATRARAAAARSPRSAPARRRQSTAP